MEKNPRKWDALEANKTRAPRESGYKNKERTLSQEEQICDVSVNQDGVILN